MRRSLIIIYCLFVAVVLSAQTTDVSVNKVTVKLFEKYPDAASLAAARRDRGAPLFLQAGHAPCRSPAIS